MIAINKDIIATIGVDLGRNTYRAPRIIGCRFVLCESRS